jgi:ribosome biogenesis protein SSF1/2
VEDGLLGGEVLFHELVSKTEEEKLLIQKKREKNKKLKEKRKKIQEENKHKKEARKQELKEKSLKGIQKKKESDIIMQKIAKESYEANKSDSDDDAQYYRDEVGQEPDNGEYKYLKLQYAILIAKTNGSFQF